MRLTRSIFALNLILMHCIFLSSCPVERSPCWLNGKSPAGRASICLENPSSKTCSPAHHFFAYRLMRIHLCREERAFPSITLSWKIDSSTFLSECIFLISFSYAKEERITMINRGYQHSWFSRCNAILLEIWVEMVNGIDVSSEHFQ